VLFRKCFLLLSALLVGALALPFASPVAAAAPRFILADGSLLSAPILLTDWSDNLTLMAATAEDEREPNVRYADLDPHASVRLCLFWNSLMWEPYVQQHGLEGLHPGDANQFARFYPAFARFYPATATTEAVYDGMLNGRAGLHRISVRGLTVLAQAGIPTRVDAPLPSGAPGADDPVLLSGG